MIILALVLFAVSFILAIFGKGGGEFYIPIFLTAGIPFSRASATSLFLIMTAGLSMMIVYHRKSLVDWKTAFIIILASASGAFLGGLVSSSINPLYLKATFALLLIVSAYFISRPVRAHTHRLQKVRYEWLVWRRKCCGESYCFSLLIVLPLIFLVAFLAGMVGISGGGLIVPILVLIGGMHLRVAFATNSVMVFFSSFTGFLGHAIKTGIDWHFTLVMALFVASGAVLGAHYSSRFKLHHMKRAFAWILIIAAAWTLAKIFV